MVCSLPVSSVYGLFQAKIREWIAISYFRGASWPRDRTHISCTFCIGRQILFHGCHLRSLEDPLLEFNKVYTVNLELEIILIPDIHTHILDTYLLLPWLFFSSNVPSFACQDILWCAPWRNMSFCYITLFSFLWSWQLKSNHLLPNDCTLNTNAHTKTASSSHWSWLGSAFPRIKFEKHKISTSKKWERKTQEQIWQKTLWVWRKSENPCVLETLPWEVMILTNSGSMEETLQEFRREWLWKHPIYFSKQYSHF